MRLRITAECDGFARCSDLAPEVFTTPDEPHFRTVLLRDTLDEESEEELVSRVISAIQRCPKRAIRTDLAVEF